MLHDGFSSSKVYIVWGYVAERLVVAPGVVVFDEGVNFGLDFIGGLPYDEVYRFFQGTVVAFDLSVGLRVVR